MTGQELWEPPSPDAREPFPVGLTVPGYSNLAQVARGGDSIVYRARQDGIDRDVAIKVIDVNEDYSAARFERELAITLRLGRQHPHIVTVLDTTTASTGQPCLIMEFHDLGSVHDRIRAHGPLPVSDVVAAGTAVADALAFAHSHGILHRDVKPQNILLLPTSYVLSDFGIARMADAGHTASLERFSYRHASPQILDGLEPTEADDVWSLGSTLFTLLTGRATFAADDPNDDTALAYLRRVRTNERRELPADIPTKLREVITGCLTPDREERIPTAAEVLSLLRSVPTEDRSWAPGAETLASTPPARVVAAPEPDEHSPPVSTSTPVHAASALADLELAEPASIDDSEHTSARPAAAAETAPTEDSQAASSGSGTRSSNLRKIIAFISGALVVGAGIGIVSALLNNEEEQPVTPPPAASPVPVESDPLPTQTGPVQAQTSDLTLAPRTPAALHNGTSVLLTWAEPEASIDYLLVLKVTDTGDQPEILAQLSADSSEYLADGIDPNEAETCFALAGYQVGEEGRPVAGATEPFCAVAP